MDGAVRAAVEQLEQRTYLSGLTGVGTILQAAANQSLDVGDIDGSGALYVGSGVNVTVDSVQEGSLTVNGNLVISSAAGLQNESRQSAVNSLTINGALDLTDNVLLINYGTGSDPVSTIRGYLTSGRNGGAWNGTTGITSSTAAVNGGYALGYADGAEGVVSGLASGQIEIRYTLVGDALLNGSVSGQDFTIMTSNLGKSFLQNGNPVGWDDGDFLYAGGVTGGDFTAILGNLGRTSNTGPAPTYTIPPQYVATFTDSASTPLNLITAGIDWGDGSAATPGAIVSDGNGTFHVIANHTYSASGTFQVTTTITDNNSSTTATVNSTAVVSATPFSAVPLDAYDIQLTWADQPILDSGQTLEFSDDPTFLTDVTTIHLAGHVTDYIASSLSPSTAYYFQIQPSTAGMPIVGSASATTDPSDGMGGTSGPTAPVITQAASYTQPTPTMLSVRMSASSADPLSYSWQLVSGPGGPPPAFTNSEQTTSVILSAAGTYDFRGTATDDYNSLPVSSDVTVTVSQTASGIAVSPGSAQVALGGTSQFSATEDDQFGNRMTSQPSFSWSVADTRLGTINSSGLFTAASNKAGLTTIQASASGSEGTTSVMVGGGAETITLGNLALGTVVSTQFPGVTFSAPSGYTDKVFNDPPVRLGDFQGSSYAFSQGLTLAFADPVNNLSYVAGYFDSTAGTVVGSVAVYTNGSYAGAVNEISPGPGSNGTVNLSAYSGITKIVIGSNTDPAGLGYTSFTFTPIPVGIALGDGSANQVLQASNDGTQNLVPLHLFVPSGLPNGTVVQLSTNHPHELEVWASNLPGANLLTGVGQAEPKQWTVGTDTIPTTVYVGATAGSASVGDILFTLAINPGSSPPGPSATTQPATAVQINSLVVSDANNPENTVTSTDNSGRASVIAMADQSTGEASINLSVDVTPQSLVGQQNMLWEVIDQNTGQVVNGGTFSDGSFDGLTLRPTAHDDSTYTVKVGFASPGQTTLQPNQVTQSVTLYVVTTESYFEFGAVGGEDTGSVAVQNFYDSNPNAMSEELSGPITIDWGDGNQGTGTIQDMGDDIYAVMGDHTYENGGYYTVNVTLTTLGTSSGHARAIAPPAAPGPIANPTEIYYLNDVNGAGGAGHAAIIIPNGAGCTYFSYGDDPNDSNHLTVVNFANIRDALAAAKQGDYTREEDWDVTQAGADAAIQTALSWNGTPYHAKGHNCWDMVYACLKAAGLSSEIIMVGDIPNVEFDLNKLLADGWSYSSSW